MNRSTRPTLTAADTTPDAPSCPYARVFGAIGLRHGDTAALEQLKPVHVPEAGNDKAGAA